MVLQKHRKRIDLWDLFKILIGSVLTGLSFRCLTFPNHIVSGGVTGISQILNLLTGFPVGAAVIFLNVPLFLWAWRSLGKRFVVLTGVCMVLSSLAIDLLEPVARPITADLMLAAVYIPRDARDRADNRGRRKKAQRQELRGMSFRPEEPSGTSSERESGSGGR